MILRPLVAALAALLVAAFPVAAQSTVTSCGRLIAFEAPTAQRPIGQVSINEEGRERDFQVSGSGQVSPPDVSAIGTALNPVLVRFQGTAAANGVVTNFTLTRVTTCEAGTGLPSTATQASPGAENASSTPRSSPAGFDASVIGASAAVLAVVALVALLLRGRTNMHR